MKSKELAILDKTKICLCEKLKLNEWKNTTDVINWFEKIDEKQLHTFTKFNIKDFYQSIKKNFIKKTLCSLLRNIQILTRTILK